MKKLFCARNDSIFSRATNHELNRVQRQVLTISPCRGVSWCVGFLFLLPGWFLPGELLTWAAGTFSNYKRAVNDVPWCLSKISIDLFVAWGKRLNSKLLPSWEYIVWTSVWETAVCFTMIPSSTPRGWAGLVARTSLLWLVISLLGPTRDIR